MFDPPLFGEGKFRHENRRQLTTKQGIFGSKFLTPGGALLATACFLGSHSRAHGFRIRLSFKSAGCNEALIHFFIERSQ